MRDALYFICRKFMDRALVDWLAGKMNGLVFSGKSMGRDASVFIASQSVDWESVAR